MLNLVDHFGGTFLIFVLAIGELTGVMWIYGLQNICNDVKFMIDRRPGWYWRVCWMIITPVFMIFVFIYSMATLEPLLYAGQEYPDSAYSELNIDLFICENFMKFSDPFSRWLGFLWPGSHSNPSMGNLGIGCEETHLYQFHGWI